MATENVPFRDAIFILKNNIVNKSATFSDTVSKSKYYNVKEPSSVPIVVSDESFPNIAQSHSGYKKRKNFRSPHKENNIILPERTSYSIPGNIEYSSPNGSFLKYMSENTYARPAEKSWVTSLANQISQTLISTSSSFSSHSSLNKVIESHIINFFSSIQNGTQEQ